MNDTKQTKRGWVDEASKATQEQAIKDADRLNPQQEHTDLYGTKI